MTLLFALRHRNKENEPPRKVIENPYVTRKKVPAKSSMATSKAPLLSSSQDPLLSSSKAPPSSKALPLSNATTSASIASSSSLATIEEETSPAIRRILEATGCSSGQELLAMRAAQARQQVNANGSTSAANPNRSKAAMNGDKASKSSNGSKATNGSKTATANPKKKARSKHFIFA